MNEAGDAVQIAGEVRPGDHVTLAKLSPAACRVDVNGRLQAPYEMTSKRLLNDGWITAKSLLNSC